MDVVTALPSLARGMLDGITRHIGLTVGKGPPFVYLPSWVPTRVHESWRGTKQVATMLPYVDFSKSWYDFNISLNFGWVPVDYFFGWSVERSRFDQYY